MSITKQASIHIRCDGESTTLLSILNIACPMRPYSFTTRLVNWILASVDWND